MLVGLKGDPIRLDRFVNIICENFTVDVNKVHKSDVNLVPASVI